jgi:hypothetical protein
MVLPHPFEEARKCVEKLAACHKTVIYWLVSQWVDIWIQKNADSSIQPTQMRYRRIAN